MISGSGELEYFMNIDKNTYPYYFSCYLIKLTFFFVSGEFGDFQKSYIDALNYSFFDFQVNNDPIRVRENFGDFQKHFKKTVNDSLFFFFNKRLFR